MQRSLWMRPALQKSEAVLLPALQRVVGEPQFSDPYYYITSGEDPFVPIQGDEMAPAPQAAGVTTTALSTYVRPRGSMAGRSVLRAAGVAENPYMRQGARPTYYQKNQNQPKPNRRNPYAAYGYGWMA
ncbi:MAG: hypothetical protein VB099_15695 [Candidatus Limiplasma sp.]|nr:hypothetical protein [Candidatus Limiplasma sp.]